MLEMSENDVFSYDTLVLFASFLQVVWISYMQKQPQSGGQREEGAPHEMT